MRTRFSAGVIILMTFWAIGLIVAVAAARRAAQAWADSRSIEPIAVSVALTTFAFCVGAWRSFLRRIERAAGPFPCAACGIPIIWIHGDTEESEGPCPLCRKVVPVPAPPQTSRPMKVLLFAGALGAAHYLAAAFMDIENLNEPENSLGLAMLLLAGLFLQHRRNSLYGKVPCHGCRLEVTVMSGVPVDFVLCPPCAIMRGASIPPPTPEQRKTRKLLDPEPVESQRGQWATYFWLLLWAVGAAVAVTGKYACPSEPEVRKAAAPQPQQPDPAIESARAGAERLSARWAPLRSRFEVTVVETDKASGVSAFAVWACRRDRARRPGPILICAGHDGSRPEPEAVEAALEDEFAVLIPLTRVGDSPSGTALVAELTAWVGRMRKAEEPIHVIGVGSAVPFVFAYLIGPGRDVVRGAVLAVEGPARSMMPGRLQASRSGLQVAVAGGSEDQASWIRALEAAKIDCRAVPRSEPPTPASWRRLIRPE